MKNNTIYPMTYSDFCTTKDGVFKRISKNSSERISSSMEILSIEEDLDTSVHSATIAYTSFDEVKYITVPRSTYLQRRKLLELQDFGVDITEDNASSLTKYFKEEEEKKMATKKYTHSTLGFSKYNDKLIFKHYKAIGIESTYSGPYDVRPRGSYKDYMKMIQEEVLDNPAMEFIIVCGLSSVLLAYLSHEYILDSLVIHLASDSTTGKSTALKMASSLWSIPDVKEDSLFSTYNGTNNAILNKLTGLNGIPYFLDEISMSNINNFSSFIYTLVNGVEKERLTKDAKLMAKKSWITTLLSNGERSLINSANKNKGIAARVFEVKNVTFTRDAENAENIQRVIHQNYGLVGPKYTEYIMSLNKEDICKRFEEMREEFSNLVKTSQSTDDLFKRRTLKFSILLLTAEYFEKFSGVTLSKNTITKFIMKIEAESTRTRNYHAHVMEYIKDYVAINAAAFGLTGNAHSIRYGTVTPKSDYIEVLFYKTSFDEMIYKGHYEESSIVLKELKAKGYLDCETDRYTRSRKMPNGIKQDVYILKLDKAIMQKFTKDQKEEGDEKHE